MVPTPQTNKRRNRIDLTGPNRCASATLNGYRCMCHILYPLKICTIHARYFVSHRRLPIGGTTSPFVGHHCDTLSGIPLDRKTPEMLSPLTPEFLALLEEVQVAYSTFYP